MTGRELTDIWLPADGRAFTATRRSDGRFQRGLAALIIVLLPLGNLWTVGAVGRSFPIPLAWIPCGLLVIHFVLTSLSGLPDRWADRRDWPRLISALLAVSLVLSLSLFLATSFWSGLAAYLNFIIGVFGGAAVGWTWATARRHIFSVIDLATFAFITIVSLEVFRTRFLLQDGQRISSIEWGFDSVASANYIAAILVVASLLSFARIRQVKAVNGLWYLIPIAASVAALITLSRGAAVALAAGFIALLWNFGSTPRTRMILRASCTLIPIVAIGAVGVFTYQRTLVNQQALVNIFARFDLIAVAWDEFLKNPILGTGWASLRTATFNSSEQNTFAHNFVLSFMQLGGLTGLLFTILLCVLVIRALRLGSLLAAPLVGAVALALFNPFFESFVGSLLTFGCGVLALSERSDGIPGGGD